MVYFIQNARGHVKIGTAINIKKRLSALQGANSEPLEVIREIEGGTITEKWLHQRFAQSRLLGEWFAFDAAMLTIVPPSEPAPTTTPNPERAGSAFGPNGEIGAAAIIDDIRSRLHDLPNVAEFCRRSGLAQGGISKLLHESRDHTIHWLATVDRALREHGEKSDAA